jgi:hypothetical protein
MAIIGTLPNNIQNGQGIDAVPVMADFNHVVTQVNANAAPLDSPALTGTPTTTTPLPGDTSGRIASAAFVAAALVAALVQAGADEVAQAYTKGTTAGTAPNFTLAPTTALAAYAPFQRYNILFHAAGTGADQLNVSGLGNKALKQYNSAGTKIPAVIAAGMLADIVYDGTDFVILDSLPPLTAGFVEPGTIIEYSGATPPAGYLAVPTAATNINRTTYAALFAAIDIAWGAGDGSTTFGMPFCPAGYVFAQGTLAAQSAGTVISHSHRWSMTGAASYSAGGGIAYFPADRVAGSTIENTELTGGAANLAASVGITYCVKY